MPANNYHPDFQDLDCKLDDAQAADVAVGKDVGDVAVHKDLAGKEIQQGGFGNARVAASDPQDLRSLSFCERGEQRGIERGGPLRPGFVPGEEIIDGVGGLEAEDACIRGWG